MDEQLLECGYCGGRAVKGALGYEHADSGNRVTVSGPGDFVSARHNQAGTPILAVDLVESCRHSWVAGMMVVNDEDLDTVAAMRDVTCEKCDEVYRGQ